MKKIAINGFGRIGRLTLKMLMQESDVEVVAINDLGDANSLKHLFKYDSVYGGYFANELSIENNILTIDEHKILIFQEKDPAKLPWKKLDIDLVVESTGFFTSKEKASSHIKAGAKHVIITTAAKDKDIKTIVFNVNHEILKKNDQIISGASCTTNCLAPVVKVLNDNFKIKAGIMTTIHAATNDQRVSDNIHEDLRRARSIIDNIIPTTTGAAKAIGKVIPDLNGKLNGSAMRVPVMDGSVIELTFELEKNPTVDEVNKAIFENKNETLGYTDEPIVSRDIVGMKFGSLFDSQLTMKLDNSNFYKITSWYDNEMSYVSQLIRTIKYFINL